MDVEDRNLGDAHAAPPGPHKQLDVVGEAGGDLRAEQALGRICRQQLEAALGISDVQPGQQAHGAVEALAEQLAVRGTPLDDGPGNAPRADRDVGAVVQGGRQLGQLAERGREVGVGEQHVVALGVADALRDRGPLPPVSPRADHRLEPGIGFRGRGEDLPRSIVAAVVDDQRLQELHPAARDIGLGACGEHVEERRQAILLVVGRDDEGEGCHADSGGLYPESDELLRHREACRRPLYSGLLARATRLRPKPGRNFSSRGRQTRSNRS